MDNIDAGDLRHMVSLYRANPAGAPPGAKPVYDLVGTYFALVHQKTAAELVNATQIKGMRSYMVTIRKRQINPTDYLLWHGRKLNVLGSTDDDFGIFTEVDCTEQLVNQ